MSSYLITGGAGFIGSHLADRLIENGHNVTILDNLSTGKLSNINKKCVFIKGDIQDLELLEKAFNGIDFCYHLAAVASVQKSMDNWLDTHKVNLGGTINVFLESSKRKIPVVYASSAAIYGEPVTLPLKETSQINPTSPYGLDKYCCELQAKLFGSIHKLKTLGLRFFNVYGSRQDPHSPYSGVISIFLNKMQADKELTVYGDGTQERDFVFIEDVIDVLIKSQNYVSIEAKAYNVSTNSSLSINQLIEILFQTFAKKIPVTYLPFKEGDIYKSIGNNSKINHELNCQISTKLSPNTLKTILNS